MTLNDYQEEACKTKAKSTSQSLDFAVLALGLTGEAGEVADEVKKIVGHGHGLNREKLSAELGDVLWYVAVLADQLGVSLNQIAAENIKKLRARYPQGFSTERSLHRDEHK